MNTFVTTSLLIYFVCWSQKFVSSNQNPPSHNPTPTPTNPVNSQITPVELDIKKDAGTNEFDYSKNGKIGTYTAKQGYAFSKVYQKKGSCSCGSDKIIWEADRQSEYASIVVVDGIDSNTKTVTIHLPNNKTRTFHKPGLLKSWSETTPPTKNSKNQSTPTTPNLSGSTVVSNPANPESLSPATTESEGSSVSEDQSSKQPGSAPDPSTAEGSEQNKTETSKDGDGSQSANGTTPAEGSTPTAQNPVTFILDIPDIPSQDVDKTEYKCKKYGGTYDYDMKDNYQCTEVKLDGQTVWKHQSGEYPKTVVYESDKHFIIHFSGDFFDFKKNKEEKWERIAKHFDCVDDIVDSTPGNNQSDGQGTPTTPNGGSTPATPPANGSQSTDGSSVTTPSGDGSKSGSTPVTPSGGSAQS